MTPTNAGGHSLISWACATPSALKLVESADLLASYGGAREKLTRKLNFEAIERA